MKLMTSKQVTESGSFRDIAHMEEESFESALSVAIQMIISNEHGAKRCDITNWIVRI